jgi:2-methylisocitrate lyase-like PEP mutase family enzyme
MPLTTADKRATFRKMHESGCFVLPNPFDVGTAKALQHLGFKAIASTSAGFAWTLGKADNRVTLDDVCAHLDAICAAVDIPVNADFEGGFAVEPDDRLQAYADAGADCLYAPGLKTKDEIATVVKAVHPKPFNLLIGASGLSLKEAEALGVRRISVGGSLARNAWAGFMKAAKEMADKGTFTELASGYPGGELNKMFG